MQNRLDSSDTHDITLVCDYEIFFMSGFIFHGGDVNEY